MGDLDKRNLFPLIESVYDIAVQYAYAMLIV